MYNYRKLIEKNYQGKAFKNEYKVNFQHSEKTLFRYMMQLKIQQNNEIIKLMS